MSYYDINLINKLNQMHFTICKMFYFNFLSLIILFLLRREAQNEIVVARWATRKLDGRMS